MGLIVGSTLQLLVLGVGTFGGATIPDFATGAIIGTALGVVSDKGVEFAVGISVPVGLLMVQLDILARFCNVYFVHRVDAHIENGDYDKIEYEAWLSLLPIALSRAFPVFLSLVFGNEIIDLVLTYSPSWLMGGLKLAGAILPVVGIAILLRYLPIRKFLAYLLIGYLLAAYFKLPMMGIALVGLALSILYFKHLQEKTVFGQTDRSEVDDDEI